MTTQFSIKYSVQIPDQESARKARPGDPFTFTVDASKTGWGEVAIDVVYDNRSIRRTFYVEEVENRIYNVCIKTLQKNLDTGYNNSKCTISRFMYLLIHKYKEYKQISSSF